MGSNLEKSGFCTNGSKKNKDIIINRLKTKGDVKMVECIVCGAKFDLPKDTEEGEIIECPECGSELEVVSVNPIELAQAPEEEEDWGE